MSIVMSHELGMIVKIMGSWLITMAIIELWMKKKLLETAIVMSCGRKNYRLMAHTYGHSYIHMSYEPWYTIPTLRIFRIKIIFPHIKNGPAYYLIQHWHCSCKFKSRRSGSWLVASDIHTWLLLAIWEKGPFFFHSNGHFCWMLKIFSESISSNWFTHS
jgi:hypothetical protein